MGLGKTLMTIATLFALHRRQKDKVSLYCTISSAVHFLLCTHSNIYAVHAQRFIVVCPSTLVSNWAKEFDKWIGKASQPKRVVVRKGGEQGLQTIRAFVPIKPHQSEGTLRGCFVLTKSATPLT